MEGIIFDIQRFCLNDGPGIRTTVFLKGCMLNCKWCHNPESKSTRPQLAFQEHTCVNCGRCVDVCQQNVHNIQNGRHVVAFKKCIQCGNCVNSCPEGALRILGKAVTTEEIIKEVKKDRPFFDKTGGGITLSGGEPMLQAEFAVSIAMEAKKNGLHVAMETSGFAKKEDILRIAPYVDVVLFDYKVTQEERHRALTGVSKVPIEENCSLLESLEKEIILRCPLIPGYNIDKEHVRGIARTYLEHTNIHHVEVLPYHALGESKSLSIGELYDMKKIRDDPDTVADEVIQELKKLGVNNVKRG